MQILPHVNASLNGLATVLLVLGFVQIKRGQEVAHKWTMLSCFGVSVIFLVCYLTYHSLLEGHGKPFPSYPPTAVRIVYYVVLLTHIVLAAAVPFLAVATIYYGLRDNRPVHCKLAKVTFPIWLYVSVTGVFVYLMLYQFYPPLVDAAWSAPRIELL
ncbi:MAG: DUF420 domain-containing protein [Blastopirellula sp. JB062]